MNHDILRARQLQFALLVDQQQPARAGDHGIGADPVAMGGVVQGTVTPVDKELYANEQADEKA